MENQHDLKTIQPHFNHMWNNLKTFEIRKDDRNFKVGDVVRLHEYDPQNKTYSNSQIIRLITHILRDAPELGLMPGYCILSLKPLNP